MWRSGLLAGVMACLGACSPSGSEDPDPAIEQQGPVGPGAAAEIAVAVGEVLDGLSARGAMVTVEAQTGEAGRYTQDCTITETSIAGISRPVTLGAFAGAFPAGSSLVFEPLYMVDFGSLCLVVEGRERVCTLFYELDAEAWTPGAEALGLYTKDPACRTADGIGPGGAVSAAVDVLGAPEFSFNYDNEGREYVHFAGAPSGLGFRVASAEGDAIVGDGGARDTMWPNGSFGGDYREGAENFATRVAFPDAVIAEVSIY